MKRLIATLAAASLLFGIVGTAIAQDTGNDKVPRYGHHHRKAHKLGGKPMTAGKRTIHGHKGGKRHKKGLGANVGNKPPK